MKEINLKYLDENFLTLDEIVEKTGVSSKEIKDYIKKELTPQPSYVIEKTLKITSPLNDKHKVKETILYFPKSYINLVKNCKTQNAKETKQKFIGEMKQHLLSHQNKTLAYENAVSNENKLEKELESEWDYYQKGIYGICTLNATPKEIIEKEVAVKKLLKFLDTYSEDHWESRKDELIQIIAEYDEVSNLFAPYQRELSSRGKYVDKPLQKIRLNDKIKTY